MPVMIGVDPHKASHTAAALDKHGQLLDQQRIPATLDLPAKLAARVRVLSVAQANTSLLRLFGVGPVLAATFLGEVGDIGRFPTKHHFAAHTGAAPLEASSGQVIRHRCPGPGTASSTMPCP
jgi:transposase